MTTALELRTGRSRLKDAVEKARTPAEQTLVLDLAAALEGRAKRVRKLAAEAGLIQLAREAYGAQIDALFSRLDVVCRIANALPDGRGTRTDLSHDATSSDFGIHRATAARWKNYRDLISGRDRDELYAGWLAHVEREPGEWPDPTMTAVVRPPGPDAVETPALPTGTYGAVVIDPPWPMGKSERIDYLSQTPHLDYPVMPLDEIGELPIGDLVGPGGHLYLWTTQRFLPDAFAIVKQWDLTYHCLLTWAKTGGFAPFSWMFNAEHVVFAYRPPFALDTYGLKICFEAPRREHSTKPDVFYELVERVSPAPRLDMFARRERPGWEPWGA